MAYSYTGHMNGLPNPKNFTRGNPIPLDSWSLFMTYTEASNYAKTNGVAYPGQVVSVVEGQTANAYIIVAGPEITDPKDDQKTIEDVSQRTLVKLGQQSESGADIYWLNSGGTPIT